MNRLISYAVRRGPALIFDIGVVLGGLYFWTDLLIRALFGQPT